MAKTFVNKYRKQQYGKWASISITLFFAIAFLVKTGVDIYHKTHPIIYDGFQISIPYGYDMHGIDVSRYQSNIDWEAVKAMKSRGVSLSFAFIKATEGNDMVDPNFRRNWEYAAESKIIRGAYHFFRPNIDAKKQAINFIRTAQLESGDLAPVLDIETVDGVSDKQIAQGISIWLKLIEEKFGVKPIIYTNANFYTRYLGEAFDDYPLWVAHYFAPEGPRINRPWQFWQHSEKGRVNGIKGYVDFNVFYGDDNELDELRIP